MADQGASCCPRLDYRNIGPSAAWPLTSISHETYMKLDSHCISPWQKMPGFHFRSISHDWMHHTYLGTARDLCGSGTFPFASFFGLFPPKVILKLFILFFWEKNYFEHSNLFSCRYQTGSASKSVFRAKLCAQHKTKQFVTVWPGIKMLIDHGRFNYAMDGAEDMDEILSHVQKSMMDTCAKHGTPGSIILVHIYPYTTSSSIDFGNQCMGYPEFQNYHSYATLRMHLPSKPHLTSANLGAEDGYGELGTRFKASHAKLIVWWLAKESQQFADSHPDDPRTYKFIWFSTLTCPSLVFNPKLSKSSGMSTPSSSKGILKIFCIFVIYFPGAWIGWPVANCAQDHAMQVLATSSYGLQRVIEIMDHGSLVLSEEGALEAHECLHLHLNAYFWLAAYHYQQRIQLFKLRCKTHYLFHIAEDILELQLNPALFHTFDEESFLGKLKAIAIHCHGVHVQIACFCGIFYA